MTDDHRPPLEAALDVLRAGGLVGIPTETVYGLAADAANADAVRRVFAVKGRPAGHPVIVHVASAEMLTRWARDVPPAAWRLAEACWPGPLTLLVPRADHVLDVVTGGLDTVGVRVPAHPLTLELLDRFGGGLVAPSANRFGRVSPTTAAHVRADLGMDVDLVLDGGPSPVGVESTIVDCTTSPPQILRPGAITAADVERVLGSPAAPASGPSRAPGMLAAHYAPACRVVLADSATEAAAAVERLRAGGLRAEVLDAGDDVVAYAQNLYTWLRAADERGLDALVAVMPRPAGVGHAVRDRLRRAAAGGAGVTPSDPSGRAG